MDKRDLPELQLEIVQPDIQPDASSVAARVPPAGDIDSLLNSAWRRQKVDHEGSN